MRAFTDKGLIIITDKVFLQIRAWHTRIANICTTTTDLKEVEVHTDEHHGHCLWHPKCHAINSTYYSRALSAPRLCFGYIFGAAGTENAAPKNVANCCQVSRAFGARKFQKWCDFYTTGRFTVTFPRSGWISLFYFILEDTQCILVATIIVNFVYPIPMTLTNWGLNVGGKCNRWLSGNESIP